MTERAREALTKRMPPPEFVDCFVVDVTPAFFSNDRVAYLEWRRAVTAVLGVDPASLHVVGSACVGFSLDPNNGLRDFLPNSDIDVAIVSAWHFDLAWRDLQYKSRTSFRYPRRISYSIRRYAPTDVFNGCIATERILPVLPFAAEWLRARQVASSHPLIEDRTVEFRLYRDLESLRAYQLYSVAAVQASIKVDN